MAISYISKNTLGFYYSKDIDTGWKNTDSSAGILVYIRI